MMTPNCFEIKEKIVRKGESRIFNNWHENAGIEMEDFIDGLRWLCDDPMPGGRLTRELGCICRADAGMTDEQRAIWYTGPKPEGVVRLYRLTRVYDKDGHCAFYDDEGRLWGHSAECASISARDRV